MKQAENTNALAWMPLRAVAEALLMHVITIHHAAAAATCLQGARVNSRRRRSEQRTQRIAHKQALWCLLCAPVRPLALAYHCMHPLPPFHRRDQLPPQHP